MEYDLLEIMVSKTSASAGEFDSNCNLEQNWIDFKWSFIIFKK